MLFNLKNKNQNSFKLKPSIFGGLSVFNPLNLPSYQAGYLMNLTNDVPPGSINQNLISAQWFDAKVLNVGSKVLQRGNSTVTGLVNGFKCMAINDNNARLQNPTVDVLTGVFNFSVCIGFKRPAATLDYHVLQFALGSGDTIEFVIGTRNTGKIFYSIYNIPTAKGIAGDSVNTNYNNNLWHVAVVTVDQTNKKITLLTDLESANLTNPLYVGNFMTPNSSGDFRLGQWLNAPENNWSPGSIGDVLIFNTALDSSTQTKLLDWEKSRLGI